MHKKNRLLLELNEPRFIWDNIVYNFYYYVYNSPKWRNIIRDIQPANLQSEHFNIYLPPGIIHATEIVPHVDRACTN